MGNCIFGGVQYKRYNNEVKLRGKTKTLSKKIALVALGTVLLAIGLFVWRQNNTERNNPTDTESPTAEIGEVGEKATSTPESKPTENTVTTSKPEKSTTATPETAPSFAISLVRAGQVGTTIQIRALIEGVTTGSCRVDFSGPGASFYKTTELAYDGRTYSCGALDAATSQFSKAGSWDYSLKTTSGTKVSNTLTGKLTVTK